MQCNWQSLARCAQRTFISPCSPTSARPLSTACLRNSIPYYCRVVLTSPTLKFLDGVAIRLTHSQALPPRRPPLYHPGFPLAYNQASQQQLPYLNHSLEQPTPTMNQSTTRISSPGLSAPRSPAASSQVLCKIVRESVKAGKIDKTFLLVKFIIKPNYRMQLLAEEPSLGTQPLLTDVDPRRSTRLVSHTLLHALIRKGHAEEAYQVAKGMMMDDIHLRSVSLQATIRALSNMKIKKDKNAPAYASMLEKAASVVLCPNSAAKQNTRAIIDLLSVAEKTKNRRTFEMYDMLLSLCLLNGEIIVASLIFGFIAKNWQAKQSPGTYPTGQPDPSPVITEAGLESSQVQSPTTLQLFVITRAINRVVTQDGKGKKFEKSFHEALQALANLAWLLDHRLIPHEDIAFLLRTMYSCPKVETDIWILDEKNEPVKAQAYDYFHSVLARLISNLPDQPPKPPFNLIPLKPGDGYKGGVLPPLNINSYNALIHYALRHQLSPALASQILDHMGTKRVESLKVDVATVNIILTSGKLMRRPDIVNQALKILNLEPIKKWKHAMTAKSASLLEKSSQRAVNIRCFKRTLQQSLKESLVSPTLDPRNIPSTLEANTVSLSEYLSCLRSSGDPNLVATHVFDILPGLQNSGIPRSEGLGLKERKRLKNLYIHKSLENACKLGPYVFTELLNCLVKAGKWGLMHSVFAWARLAERLSWRADSPVKSWCLPIHAYTIVIEGYAATVRRHWVIHQDGDKRAQLQYWLHRIRRDSNGRLRAFGVGNANKLKIRRRGFGVCSSVQWTRNIMLERARAAYLRFGRVQAEQKKDKVQIAPPKPDARFFNALLAVHARSPGMRPRRAAPRRSQYRQLLKRCIRHPERAESKRKLRDPILLNILKEMLDAGFAIPIGLRHLFTGILKPEELAFEGLLAMDRSPRAFPRVEEKKSKSLYSIPVVKTKGLPGW